LGKKSPAGSKAPKAAVFFPVRTSGGAGTRKRKILFFSSSPRGESALSLCLSLCLSESLYLFLSLLLSLYPQNFEGFSLLLHAFVQLLPLFLLL